MHKAITKAPSYPPSLSLPPSLTRPFTCMGTLCLWGFTMRCCAEPPQDQEVDPVETPAPGSRSKGRIKIRAPLDPEVPP